MARNDRRGENKGAPVMQPTEIVERFVLRARRVAAHSLSQSRERLQAFAHTMIRGTIDLAGRFTVVEDLPDEDRRAWRDETPRRSRPRMTRRRHTCVNGSASSRTRLRHSQRPIWPRRWFGLRRPQVLLKTQLAP